MTPSTRTRAQRRKCLRAVLRQSFEPWHLAALKEHGADDAELGRRLAASIGECGGMNEHGSYEARGLKVWIDTRTSTAPTYSGRSLIAEVRSLYRIPQSGQMQLF